MILVTGGTGFLGSRLVKRLLEKGHAVRAMAVRNDPLLANLEGVPCEIAYGDITQADTLDECMRGVTTVFHLAAVLVSHDLKLFQSINYNGTKNVVDKSVEHKVREFVYVSAAAANYDVRTTYGETKHKAELLMRERHGETNFVIVRPTLLYGPGGGGQELIMYIDRLKKSKLFVPLVGSGKCMKRWVFVDDVIEGLTLLVNQPKAYGKIYNFAGGSAHSMREYTEMLCRELGIRKPVVGIPVPVCRAISAVLGLVQKKPLLRRDTILGVTMDADFSIEEARRDLGYNPIAFTEGVKRITQRV